MHVLFTTPPAPGHVYPTLPLVEELIDRRHRVTYVSGLSLAPELQQAGASVVDLGWEPHTSTLAATGFTAETLSADLRAFLAAARTLTPDLLDVLSADPPDVVCADSVPLGSLLAGIFRAPMVSLLPTLATNSEFTPAELIDGFTLNHPGMLRYFSELADWFTSYGQPVPHGHDIAGAPVARSLVFVPREFQIAGDTFDDSFHFIGPSVPHRARHTLPWQPPPSGEPVLLVSLGTAFNNRPDFFSSCAEAFADSAFHVVMATGGHVDPAGLGPLPPNVEIHRRVPQLAVLHHAAAFVTHAGMGSLMEALYHQVPTVAVPQVREQAVNAGRMEQLGLGERIDSPTADQLRDVTERVVSDPGIRTNLAAMKTAITHAGGAATGADIIETAGTL
jgi:MGT family glycosyltransferase